MKAEGDCPAPHLAVGRRPDRAEDAPGGQRVAPQQQRAESGGADAPLGSVVDGLKGRVVAVAVWCGGRVRGRRRRWRRGGAAGRHCSSAAADVAQCCGCGI